MDPRKLSLIYAGAEQNYVITIQTNFEEKKLYFQCTCQREYCIHCEYTVDFLFNVYNHHTQCDYVAFHDNDNTLWLPLKESNDLEEYIVETEICIHEGCFHFRCYHCSPNGEFVGECRHLDYIMEELVDYFKTQKEKSEEINNIDLDNMNVSSNIIDLEKLSF